MKRRCDDRNTAIAMVTGVIALVLFCASVVVASDAEVQWFLDREPLSCSGDGRSAAYSSAAVPGHPSEEFWSVFLAADTGPRPEELREMLRVHLVKTERADVRQWAIDNLLSMSWFLNLNDYEDILVECNRVHDSACVQVYMMNRLVFGPRGWKIAFLQRALMKRSGPYTEDENLLFEGQSYEIRAFDAFRLALELGLIELEPLLVRACETLRHGEAATISECSPHVRDAWFDLLGSISGDDHPVDVLAKRLAELGPEEVVGRVLAQDQVLAKIIKIHGRRLRAPTPLRKSTGWFEFVEDTVHLPLLVSVLGRAYGQFLTNPPWRLIRTERDFIRLDGWVRYLLSGGCEGFDVRPYAFATPDVWPAQKRILEEIRARTSAEEGSSQE